MAEDKNKIIIEDLDETKNIPVEELREAVKKAQQAIEIENLDETNNIPADRIEAVLNQMVKPIPRPEKAGGKIGGTGNPPKTGGAGKPPQNTADSAVRQPEKKDKKKSAKNKKIAIIAAVVLLVLAAGGFVTYYLTENSRMEAYYQDHFLPGTFINSVDCSGMTVEEVTDFFSQEAKNYKLTITDVLGQTDEITAAEINLEASFDVSFQTFMDAQDPAAWRSAEKHPVEHSAGSAWSFDEVLLSKRIDASGLFQKMTLSQDAEIVYNETTRQFEVKPEVIGTKVDLKQVKQLAIEAVKSVQHELSLADAGCYDPVKKADESMTAAAASMNEYCKGTVDLLFDPEPAESLPADVLKQALVLDASNQVTLNPEPIQTWVQSLADKYNTYGTTRTFKSTSSGTVELANDGTYGWKMNVEDTLELVLEALKSGTPYKGEAVWDKKAASHKPGADFGDSYIEVDLNVQEAYYFENGEMVWSTEVVSGCPAKGHHTVTGVYFIYEKDKDRTLRGQQADDGTYAYQSFVSYWMPFCGGYGLHDASWRGSFGGTIYKYSGSHGCVNLPYSKAKSLYNLISVGTPVVVFGGIADFGTDEPYTGAATTAAPTGADGQPLVQNPNGQWVDTAGNVVDPTTGQIVIPATTAPTTAAPTTAAPTTAAPTTAAPTTAAPTTAAPTTAAPTTAAPTTAAPTTAAPTTAAPTTAAPTTAAPTTAAPEVPEEPEKPAEPSNEDAIEGGE